MHCTITGPSHSERSSRLPGMRWSLTVVRLQQLRVELVPVLLLIVEQWRWPEQRRRIGQQRKAALVASRFVRGVYAC